MASVVGREHELLLLVTLDRRLPHDRS
jgi:hypothetical protein